MRTSRNVKWQKNVFLIFGMIFFCNKQLFHDRHNFSRKHNTFVTTFDLSETSYIHKTHHYSILLYTSCKLFSLLVKFYYACYINEYRNKQMHILLEWFICNCREVTCTRHNIHTGSTIRFLKVWRYLRKCF